MWRGNIHGGSREVLSRFLPTHLLESANQLAKRIVRIINAVERREGTVVILVTILHVQRIRNWNGSVSIEN